MPGPRPKPDAPETPSVGGGAASPAERSAPNSAPLEAPGHAALPPRPLEEELLLEVRRMNSLLSHITFGYKRWTLAFVSGMVRGLGAAIGATVGFAIFLAMVSRLDTTPLIGNYIKRVVSVVRQSGPGAAGNFIEFNPAAINPFDDSTATDDGATASGTPAAAPTPTAKPKTP